MVKKDEPAILYNLKGNVIVAQITIIQFHDCSMNKKDGSINGLYQHNAFLVGFYLHAQWPIFNVEK